MEQKHMENSCNSVVPYLSPKYPWFVAQMEDDEGDEKRVLVFYNLHDPLSHYNCRIPNLLGKRVRGCFHGCWVLLSSNQPRDVLWSLWNPITSKIINLPPLINSGSKGHKNAIKFCCLSAPPGHPNSVLLLTRSHKQNFVYCKLRSYSSFPNAHQRKQLRWTESTYAKQVRIIFGCDGSLHYLTCCNGKVYAFIKAYDGHRSLLLVEVKIVVNKSKSKDLRQVVITLLPILDIPCPFFLDCHNILPILKGSCTELFFILIGIKDKYNTVGAANVFRLDMINMKWEEMEDLKDTVLSAELATDHSSAFYSPAIASSESGGYIHILADKGKYIYSYHVKDKTISLTSIPCLARTNHVSAWAMLECTRLEGDRVHVDNKQEKAGDEEADIIVRENHVFYRLESDNADIIVRSANGDEDESHLLNLPPHVLEMVMKFSAGVEYLKFRSTCKRCHLAAPLTHWNDGEASKRLQKYTLLSPWLMVFDKHKGIITFTDPVFGDKYFMKAPQELICDFKIKCSRYGWLLILKHDGSLVFFNPFTSDIRELPQLPHAYIFSFSAPPTSPGCIVVGITIQMLYSNVCIHIVGGEPTWRTIFLGGMGIDLFYSITRSVIFNSMTCSGRDLYALRDDGGLDVFKELGKQDQSWVRVIAQAPTSICTSFAQCFLVKCDQHILRVIVGKFGESVVVFKLNGSSQEWVKIDDLGKHVIFICGASSFCLDAKTPEMENKICFPTFPIIFYSLKTCRFHTFNNRKIHKSFGDFFGTKHYLTPHAWI